MKSILVKIEFNYSFLIVALGFVITGYFSNLLVFTSLIIIHEFGHVLMCLLWNYKVDKIIIYPYGGITKIDTFVNTNIYKDLLVAISGIILQCLYFFLVYVLYKNGIIREYIYNMFLIYHQSMLFFNLLPVIPLDGFKILNLILSKFFNFNLANKLGVYISLLTILIFIFSDIYERNYSMIFVIGILMKNIYNFYNQISFIYNKFLLERYLYNFSFKNRKIISDESKMYKNSRHLIVKNGRIVDEKSFLRYFFDKK